MRFKIYFYTISFIVVLNLNFISTIKFLPSANMEQLFKNEMELINRFENHLAEQQNQLHILKLKVLELKNENRRASEYGTPYFLNPINIFSFTRRLTVDWEEIEKFILTDNILGVLESFKKFLNFPTNTDLLSAVDALFWLQDIYNLSTTSLAGGEINGIDYKTFLTSRDCFMLGSKAYEKRDFYHSIIWMIEALNNLMPDEANLALKKTILEILSESYFQIDDVNNALTVNNELLKLSNDSLYQRTKEFYESEANDMIHDTNFMNKFPKHLYEDFLEENVNYPELCRIQNRNIQISNYLNCIYENNKIPFLLIAPFKKEILSIDPLLVIFHDVISDEEINFLQEFVKDDLEAAKVNNLSRNSVASRHRVSKHKWIGRGEDLKIVKGIEKRAADITTLNMKSSEYLNINNYEIAGYYTPHLDNPSNAGYAYGKRLNSTGNRISTLIFYMNDVEQGGATVFTEIHISVLPKKGSALFWFNSHSSGEDDPRTKHAACPVLVGHKWICTIWTHEQFQSIHRPCLDAHR